MASWGTLTSMFENPLPDSLSSWSQLLPKAETETSFDMFGDICHRVKPESSPDHSSPKPRLNKSSSWNCPLSDADHNNPFEICSDLCLESNPDLCFESNPEPSPNSPKKSENLNPCIEGNGDEQANDREKKVIYRRSYSELRSRCIGDGLFPPPISSFGRSGKPRVYFKSYRQDGRFVLREIRIPTQRLLQARREDGRLQIEVVSPVGEIRRRLEVEGEAENAEQVG